ncbi:MAG: hypothetical protein J6S67_11835 [Methanobrevibacter sp.]|nr:hypothetical protein [Methanobrevibacter sp.]
MTKEEIIDNLKYQNKKHYGGQSRTLIEAIKLIEQPSSDDCVSRAEVKKWLDINFCFGGAINKLNFFEKMDKEVPPVTPTRKVGEWCKQNDDYFDWYECSECGYGSEGEMQYSSEYDVRTKFCPNCGAEMRGVEDGSN